MTTAAVQWNAAPAWPELATGDVTAVVGGLQSQAWRVAADEATFLLRYTAEVGRSHHDAEVRVLGRLQALGIQRVPVVLRGPAMDPVVGGTWTLLSWVPGLTGAGGWREHADHVGRLMARVHGALREIAAEVRTVRRYDGEHVLACCRTLVDGFVGAIPDHHAEVLLAAAALAGDAVDRLSEQSSTVLHADVHDGNVVWEGMMPGLIDFGRCGWGPALLDLAMAQHYVDAVTATALLEGYGAVEPASIDNLPALRYVAALDNLATLAEIPAERAWVVAELAPLVEQATSLMRRSG